MEFNFVFYLTENIKNEIEKSKKKIIILVAWCHTVNSLKLRKFSFYSNTSGKKRCNDELDKQFCYGV